jgi:hypothetical protein
MSPDDARWAKSWSLGALTGGHPQCPNTHGRAAAKLPRPGGANSMRRRRGPGPTNSRHAPLVTLEHQGRSPSPCWPALFPQVDYWPHEVRKGQDPQSRARRTEEHELCTPALAVPPGDKQRHSPGGTEEGYLGQVDED